MIDREVGIGSNNDSSGIFERERPRTHKRRPIDVQVELLHTILQKTIDSDTINSDQITSEMFPGVAHKLASDKLQQVLRELSARSDLLGGAEIRRKGGGRTMRSYGYIIPVQNEGSVVLPEEFFERRRLRNAEKFQSSDTSGIINRLGDDVVYNLLTRFKSFGGLFVGEHGKKLDSDPMVLIRTSSLSMNQVDAIVKQYSEHLGEFMVGLFDSRLSTYWEGNETKEDLLYNRSREIKAMVQYFKGKKVTPEQLVAKVESHYIDR